MINAFIKCSFCVHHDMLCAAAAAGGGVLRTAHQTLIQYTSKTIIAHGALYMVFQHSLKNQGSGFDCIQG